MQGLILPPLSSLPSSCNLLSRLDPDHPWKTHTDHDTCPPVSHDVPFLEGLSSGSLTCLPSPLCAITPLTTSFSSFENQFLFSFPAPLSHQLSRTPALPGPCFVEPVFLVGAKPLQDGENALAFLQPYRLARLLMRKYFSNAC